MKIRLLLMSEHPLFLLGLKTSLSESENLKIVGVVSKINEIYENYQLLKPDLLILDVNLNDIDSVNEIYRIQQIEDEPKIIILSDYSDAMIVNKLAALKIFGFVLKNEMPAYLKQAITAVSKGKNWFRTSKLTNKTNIQSSLPALLMKNKSFQSGK